MVSARGCSAISKKDGVGDETLAASLYNDQTSVVDMSRKSKEKEDYGCGGACLYKWTVNVRAQKENSSAIIEPISSVSGPELLCNGERNSEDNLNSWMFVDNLSECVSIEGASQTYLMEYYSYYPSDEDGVNAHCNCNARSSCPVWPISGPEISDNLIIPICKINPTEPLSVTQSSEEAPIKKYFQCFDDYQGSKTYNWVELYIDEDGWPLELPFPSDAFTNGVPDKTSQAYKDHAKRNSPIWQYMTIAFDDSAGKSWKRAGFYIET